MRLLIGLFILSAATSLTAAQEAVQPAQAAKVYEQAAKVYEENKAKLMAELSVVQRYATTQNAPFSAEEVNESVQTLADGNRIVRKSSGKMYRNSAGRVRREMSGGTGGMLGTTYSMGQGISIASPLEGHLFNTNLKAARVLEVPPGQAITVTTASGGEVTAAQKKAVEEKMKTLGTLSTSVVSGPGGVMYSSGAIAAALSQGGVAYPVGGQTTKYDVKTEELGTRDFEGVSAQGTRRITTIPADAIGNERSIEIVYERWFSKEIGLVVYSKNSDPRFGEQTYKLTNIVRAEPDPSLFAVPAKKLTGEQSTVYRVVAGAPVVVKTTKPAKPQN